jgi:uncharacterized protein
MGLLNIVLPTLVLGGLLPVSVIAQTPGPAQAHDKSNVDVADLIKRAQGGNTRAQLQLGIAYEFGEGTKKDLGEASLWYHAAADRGDPIAQTNLGYLYESGGNGSANPAEAAKWYLRAAVTGFARAEFNLGTLYLEGAGVERSDEEGALWIAKAADAGCQKAMAALGYLYANGRGVPQDEHKARALTKKAAKKNDPNSCSRYGRTSSDEAVSQNRDKSLGWNRDEEFSQPTGRIKYF